MAVDTLVYPACYNFRHSIELFVKYLVDACAILFLIRISNSSPIMA